MLVISGAVGGLGMLALPICTAVVPVALSLAAVGFGIVVTANAGNVYLQATYAPEKRGRVLGLFTMCFLGIAPLGNLPAGSLMRTHRQPADLAHARLGRAAVHRAV